jgi:hypothetical protein
VDLSSCPVDTVREAGGVWDQTVGDIVSSVFNLPTVVDVNVFVASVLGASAETETCHWTTYTPLVLDL